MAIFNEILAGRFNKALTKLFSLKGPAPSPALSSEVMPVIELFFGVENRFLEGWDRFGINTTQAALAAQNSAVRLRNPVGSGVVCVFEKILFFNGNAAGVAYTTDLAPTTTDLTTIVGAVISRFDARGRRDPTLIISRQNGASGLGAALNKAAIQLLATTNWDLISTHNQEITLLPGDAIQFATSAVNLELDVSCWWRERPLEDSEVKN